MNLETYQKEYEKHIELQQFFIDKCKADIQKAKMLGDRDALKLLQGNLRKFNEIKEDLELTALLLKNYYKGES